MQLEVLELSSSAKTVQEGVSKRAALSSQFASVQLKRSGRTQTFSRSFTPEERCLETLHPTKSERKLLVRWNAWGLCPSLPVFYTGLESSNLAWLPPLTPMVLICKKNYQLSLHTLDLTKNFNRKFGERLRDHIFHKSALHKSFQKPGTNLNPWHRAAGLRVGTCVTWPVQQVPLVSGKRTRRRRQVWLVPSHSVRPVRSVSVGQTLVCACVCVYTANTELDRWQKKQNYTHSKWLQWKWVKNVFFFCGSVMQMFCFWAISRDNKKISQHQFNG